MLVKPLATEFDLLSNHSGGSLTLKVSVSDGVVGIRRKVRESSVLFAVPLAVF